MTSAETPPTGDLVAFIGGEVVVLVPEVIDRLAIKQKARRKHYMSMEWPIAEVLRHLSGHRN